MTLMAVDANTNNANLRLTHANTNSANLNLTLRELSTKTEETVRAWDEASKGLLDRFAQQNKSDSCADLSELLKLAGEIAALGERASSFVERAKHRAATTLQQAVRKHLVRVHFRYAWGTLQGRRFPNDHWEGATLLHVAAQYDLPDVAKRLLEKDVGADVDAPTALGITPLHTAVYQGHVEIARLLCAAGANVNARCKNGRTAVYWASVGCRLESVKYLTSRGANLEMPDINGVAPELATCYVVQSLTKLKNEREKELQQKRCAEVAAAAKTTVVRGAGRSFSNIASLESEINGAQDVREWLRLQDQERQMQSKRVTRRSLPEPKSKQILEVSRRRAVSSW